VDADVNLLYIFALQFIKVSETKGPSGSYVRFFPSIRAVKNGRGGLSTINKQRQIADR
jgi:hypothetical protein